jgi:mRNA interferase RelE/StbE
MVYSIVYTKQALKALQGMPRDTSKLIRQKISQIALSPFSPHQNVTKLLGRDGYRLRQGDWRVIYEIQQEKIVILVLEIGLRKEVYR